MQHNPEQFLNDAEADYDTGYGYSEEFPEEEYEETESELDDLDLTKEEKEAFKKAQAKMEQQDPIMQAYREMENGPTEEQVEEFKQKAGDVYFINLSEKENFIFRPVRRQEWRTLLKQIEKLDEEKKAEAIVAKCVLFPQLSSVKINVLSAGTVETLRDMILKASNFMSPEYAVQLVRKL